MLEFKQNIRKPNCTAH